MARATSARSATALIYGDFFESPMLHGHSVDEVIE
jgi:hypothetical protein